MQAETVERVRSFNRIVTERVGALSDRFLGRDRPLGEARLLWELGSAGAEVRELRARLGLDSGYLSRLLRSLEEQGLVTVDASEADGRVRRANLTAAGEAERSVLDERAHEFAVSLLAPLQAEQQAALAAAMADVERLLTASMVTVTVEEPASPAARWCFDRYFEELDRRFEAGFDPARSISADLDELTPPAGLLLLARLRERPVGCVALKLHDEAPGELKRMWLAPDVRGLGLGRRLLREAELHASQAGAAALRLETNRALSEAIHLYRTSGYVEVDPFNDEPYADHWFEKRLPSTGGSSWV
jgi:DNA-binding MarR family transcriptional regulator